MKMTFNDFMAMTAERNKQIYALFLAGLTKAELSRRYELSRERIGQIIKAQQGAAKMRADMDIHEAEHA